MYGTTTKKEDVVDFMGDLSKDESGNVVQKTSVTTRSPGYQAEQVLSRSQKTGEKTPTGGIHEMYYVDEKTKDILCCHNGIYIDNCNELSEEQLIQKKNQILNDLLRIFDDLGCKIKYSDFLNITKQNIEINNNPNNLASTNGSGRSYF